MRKGGASAIAPHTRFIERDILRETQLLKDTALALLQYTPEVALSDDDSVLLNVGASLLFFGGPHALCLRIRQTLRLLGCEARLGMGPTARGAWLLARQNRGGPRRVLRMPALMRQLSSLPCSLLPAARPYLDWLQGIGCQTLAALYRLPRAGLQRRCDKNLLLTLDHAAGRAPELLPWIQAPPVFNVRLELNERIEHVATILHVAQRLIQQMTGWLSATHSAVASIELALEHERGRHARPPSMLEISLADPTWQAEHLLGLLKERLGRIVLDAPVIAVSLRTHEITARTVPSESLFTEPGGTSADHGRLLELLIARLGHERILGVQVHADHRPEVANHWAPLAPTSRQAARSSLPGATPALADRPYWLLEKPLVLSIHQHRPFHGSPLRLVSGPERIASGWWDGAPISRDYFMAEDSDQIRYWIFREQTQGNIRWYLHGLFA